MILSFLWVKNIATGQQGHLAVISYKAAIKAWDRSAVILKLPWESFTFKLIPVVVDRSQFLLSCWAETSLSPCSTSRGQLTAWQLVSLE